MQMNGSERIQASKEAVWAALNNVEVLKQCIPGCESLEKISETEMTAKVVLKVGPIKASFAGKVILTDLDPPNGYHISGEGSGGVAGLLVCSRYSAHACWASDSGSKSVNDGPT